METIRTGTSVDSFKKAFVDNLAYVQGKFSPIATKTDYYMALAYTIRDHLMARWTKTCKRLVLFVSIDKFIRHRARWAVTPQGRLTHELNF